MTKWFPLRALFVCSLLAAAAVSVRAGGVGDGTTTDAADGGDQSTEQPAGCGTAIMNQVDPAEALANTARLHPDIYQKMIAPKSGNPMLMKRTAGDDVQWTFNVLNQAGNNYDQVTANLKFTGKYARIWVDTSVTIVTPAMLQQLARALDTSTVATSRNPKQGIIQNDIDIAGPVPENVWMGDHMTEFLLTNIQSNIVGASILGFFYRIDQDPNDPASNHMNILYINAPAGVQAGMTSLLSTLAHEFQHLLHYPRNKYSELLYNEGCSEDASIINGYMDRGNSQFMGNTNVDLFRWSSGSALVTADYERAMTFVHYLREQFGESFYYDLIGEQTTGIERIDRTLAKHGIQTNSSTILEDFAVANLLRTNSNAVYGYQTAIKSGGTPKMAKSFAHPNYPADTTLSLERYGTVYLAYTNSAKLTQGVKLHLSGGNPFTATAILYQGTNIEVRHLGGGGDYTIGSVKPYDKIVLALVNTSSSSQMLDVASTQVALGVEDMAMTSTAGMALATAPNPFVGSTMLHFSIAESGPVTLKIFDSRGQQVSSLVEGDRFEAGSHDVVFEAGDLPNGYYVARLTQGERTVTQSLILLK